MRPVALIAAIVLLAGCASAAQGASPPPTTASAPKSTAAARTTVPPRKSDASKKSVTIVRTVTTTDSTATDNTATPALTLIREPDQGMAVIDRFLASPHHSLDMTMYELVDHTAEGILASDAARGVTVRVVLDRNREMAANTSAYQYLAAHGVRVRWAPTSYEATHEKTVVVDAGRPDARALVMTLNLTSRYYATTRDFAVLDSDRADVAAIETVFVADDAGRPVTAPRGADLVWSPGSQAALVALVASAHRTLAVENEEMSSPPIIDALEKAARRGVDVELTMTRDSEWDRAFAELTAAGVHVRLYRDADTVLYIHAKAIVADGRTAFVGSENFSSASLDDNRELGVLTSSRSVVAPLAKVLAGDFAGAAATAPSPPTTAPATTAPPTTAPPSTCHPLTDGGNCYEPGEYCRDDDHGTTGVAGDGEPITCTKVTGQWLWVAT